MTAISTLSYAAGCQRALDGFKLANMRSLIAPTLAGAAIGGVGGAAMAPDGEGTRGALVGAGVGALGGVAGTAAGHLAGSKAVNRAGRASDRMVTRHMQGKPLDAQRLARLDVLKNKALDSRRAVSELGGAAGAGAGGYFGAQAASKLTPSQPGLLPYEDDPYYMDQMYRQMPPTR